LTFDLVVTLTFDPWCTTNRKLRAHYVQTAQKHSTSIIILTVKEVQKTKQKFTKEHLQTCTEMHDTKQQTTNELTNHNGCLPIMIARPFGSTARYCPGTIRRQPLFPNVSWCTCYDNQ